MNGVVGNLSPDKLGLMGYGDRGSWKDDFLDMAVDVQIKGYASVRNIFLSEFRRAVISQEYILKDKTISRRLRRKRVKRAEA